MVILIAGIAIPTAPGFIGNWHYACILGLSLFGIAKPEALSFALVYHFLSMIVLIVLGVAFLPFNKFSITDMTKHIVYISMYSETKNDYHYVSNCYTFKSASPDMKTRADQDEKRSKIRCKKRGIP